MRLRTYVVVKYGTGNTSLNPGSERGRRGHKKSGLKKAVGFGKGERGEIIIIPSQERERDMAIIPLFVDAALSRDHFGFSATEQTVALCTKKKRRGFLSDVKKWVNFRLYARTGTWFILISTRTRRGANPRDLLASHFLPHIMISRALASDVN